VYPPVLQVGALTTFLSVAIHAEQSRKEQNRAQYSIAEQSRTQYSIAQHSIA